MKKRLIPEPDEFFVGYLPVAPPQTSTMLRWIVICVGIAIVAIGITVVVSQREFSTANFDYGQFTSIEGFLYSEPVPHIRVDGGFDLTGSIPYQTVLLVGEGKAGADVTIKRFESVLGSLQGQFVRLQGQLIHGHHKALLQLSAERLPERIEHGKNPLPVALSELGAVSISGEIVDPKCYFGVMKPGEGKPHRSCAIRCIAGGIPPVFHVSGMTEYYVLLGENLGPVNQQVLDIVGDYITLNGKAYQLGDWRIILLNEKSLKEQTIAGRLRRNLMAMQDGITSCKN
jgi:hypothetical protein